jgi:hypothetical protein
MVKNFEFGFVVSTLGRTAEITRLLESLERQTVRDFDVVVDNQNIDDRLCLVFEARKRPLCCAGMAMDSGVQFIGSAGLPAPRLCTL